MVIATSTALILAAGAAVAGGAVAASSNAASKRAAKSSREAIQSQERIAANELSAAQEGEQLAADTAKNKLKLRRASQTKTILTNPTGLQPDDEQINQSSLGTG